MRRDSTHRPTSKESCAPLYDRRDIEEFQRCPGGIWLPRQVVTTRWRVPADGEPLWLSTAVFRSAQIEVNPKVQDAELVPQLPNSVTVVGPRGVQSVKGDDTSALEEALKKGVFPPPLEFPGIPGRATAIPSRRTTAGSGGNAHR